MFNQAISAVLMLVLITILGANLLKLIRLPNMTKIEKIFFGFILGNGIFTYIVFLLNLRGLKFTSLNLFFTLLALNIFILIAQQIFYKKNIETERQSIRVFYVYNLIFWILLAYLGITTFSTGLIMPARDWDSLVLYDFRALTFTATGYMKDGIERGYFFGYPLLSSLSHTWAYLSGWKYPTFIHALYYLSFLISTHYFAKTIFTRQSIANISVLFMAFSPSLLSHAFMTYTNLMYCVYLILGYLAIISWEKTNKLSYLMISLISIWLSTWTRINEPFWLIAVIIVILVSINKRKWLIPIAYYEIISLLQKPWTDFEHKYMDFRVSFSQAIPGYMSILAQGFEPSRIKEVFIYLFQNVFLQDKAIYLLCLLLITYTVLNIIRGKIKFSDILLPGLIVGNLGLIFVGTYIFSFTLPSWKEIGNSASRMSMFLAPMIIFWSLYILDQRPSRESNK